MGKPEELYEKLVGLDPASLEEAVVNLWKTGGMTIQEARVAIVTAREDAISVQHRQMKEVRHILDSHDVRSPTDMLTDIAHAVGATKPNVWCPEHPIAVTLQMLRPMDAAKALAIFICAALHQAVRASPLIFADMFRGINRRTPLVHINMALEEIGGVKGWFVARKLDADGRLLGFEVRAGHEVQRGGPGG